MIDGQKYQAVMLSDSEGNLDPELKVAVQNFPAGGGGTLPAEMDVNVQNFPASQAVTVSNFPSSQNVAVSNFPSSQAVSVQNFPSQQAIKPGIPAAADLLAGSNQATASTTAVTFLTIPAGRTWRGDVTLGIAATATVAFGASVNTAGTGVSPAAGAIVRTVCVGAGGNNSVTLTGVTIAAPVGNAVTLQVQSSATSAGSLVSASACGVLL
jgi:hypothetical protein